MEQWIREGFSNYYVVEKKQEITYEKEILLRHPIKSLLPCEFRMEDEKEYYYYETGRYERWWERKNQMEPQNFFYDIFLALEEIEGYLLNLDHLILQKELMFLDEDEKPVLCYFPEYEKNILEQMRELLEEIMEHISYENKEKVKFYFEFHSFLVKKKPAIDQVIEYLKPEQKQQMEEEVPEEQEIEEVEMEQFPEDRKGKSMIGAAGAVLFAALFVYSLIEIFRYGFYYLYVLGAMVSMAGFFGCLYFLWRIRKESGKIEELSLDTKTELLTEEEKTIYLLEEPVGYLISKKNPKEKICIHDSGFVIGSSLEGTDYCLSAIGVSRRHMKIQMENNKVMVEDLKSTNGTRINGKIIAKEELNQGDVVKIGLEEYEFHCEEET